MSIAEQALTLLDIVPSIRNRKKLENFSSLDPVINASLPGALPASTAPEESASENLYTVASRMGRSNYEEHAKAEALLHALRQLRAQKSRPAHGNRVLRGT